MSEINKCKVCNNPIGNFGIHDLDDGWFCTGKCLDDHLAIKVIPPKDFVEGDDDDLRAL